LAVALIFIFLGSVLPVRSNLPIEVGLSYRGGWSVVSNALKERPILGSGPETFVFEYAKYKPIGINSTAFWNVRFSNASAQILTLASDLGIFGILAFLAMVIMFIIKTVRVLARNKEVDILKKFLGIAIFSGWMALLISWFLYPQNFTLIFLFWLLMGLFLTENNPEKEYEYNFKNSPKALLITSLAFVVVIILVIGLLYVEGIKFIAEISYRRGINLVQTQEGLEKGMNSLVKSTVINPYADNTYQMLSQLFLYKINLDAAKQDLSQQDRANLVQLDASNAINAAVRATQLSPQDAYNWLLRGQIYRQLVAIVGGAGEWAEASYNEAIKLEPSNPFAYLELGRLYTNRADLIVEQARKDNAVRKQWDDFMVNALKNFDKAIELKPNYAPAHFEEAVVFDKQGKLKEAIAKMEINRQLLPNDSGTAFQLGVLYYRAEMYAQAKGEFIRAIVIDDNYSNARYFLGLLYDREGSKEDAIDQFDRILQANPGNEQIEQILANLKAGKPALGSEKLGPPEQPSEIPIEEVPKAQK
jgi:tetratricopeptide (TPR) repeat protein